MQMANFQRPIGNYMGVMQPMNIQQTANPYLYPQTQQSYYPVNAAYQHQQQVNWLPVQMLSNQTNPAIIVPINQNPTQQQYWRANHMNQFQNRFTNSSNLNINNGSGSTLIPNPWDPAMSTNVSSLISQSIHTTPSSENSTHTEKKS